MGEILQKRSTTFPSQNEKSQTIQSNQHAWPVSTGIRVEQWSKSLLHFIESWLVDRDPYNGLLEALYSRVVLGGSSQLESG